MDNNEIIDKLREGTNDIFVGSIKHFRNNDLYRHYKSLGLARELYHFFEDIEMINLCNKYFQRGLEKGNITIPEKEMYEEIGKQKAGFLIGLVLEGREYLERRINEQEDL